MEINLNLLSFIFLVFIIRISLNPATPRGGF